MWATYKTFEIGSVLETSKQDDIFLNLKLLIQIIEKLLPANNCK